MKSQQLETTSDLLTSEVSFEKHNKKLRTIAFYFSKLKCNELLNCLYDFLGFLILQDFIWQYQFRGRKQ